MESNKISSEGIISDVSQYKKELYGSDFPIHVLPTQLKEIVYATSERLNYPPDYIAIKTTKV